MTDAGMITCAAAVLWWVLLVDPLIVESDVMVPLGLTTLTAALLAAQGFHYARPAPADVVGPLLDLGRPAVTTGLSTA
jgi:hypothetical protein